MAIRIVTDSTADIPKYLVEKHNIIVLPLTVRFGDEEYRDGVDISEQEFYDKLSKSTSLPTTSQVAPSMFIDTYNSELKNGNSIISIHISSDFSGTYQSAVLARQSVDSHNVALIDSRSATLSLGMIVIKAAELVDKGLGLEEIVKEIEEYKKKVRIIIAVDTLKYLKMGGRLSGTQALIGDMLNIKPLLTIENGKVVLLEKARGQKKVISRIIEIIEERGRITENSRVGIVHAMCPDTASELEGLIKEKFKDVEFYKNSVGSVIATHVGPGAFGVVFEEI